jgi:transcriptional regulator with XRE-family HTH domain
MAEGPTSEDRNIGSQVAFWRLRRGKSQRVLAGLAGLSQPYLSQIESGKRPVERRTTLIALANALGVSVADLTGQPGDPTDPAKAAAAVNVPAIREALIRREVGEVGEPRFELGRLMDSGGAYDFATAAPMLPDLLGGLRGSDLIQAAHIGVYTLKDLGYADLARDAARLAAAEARELGEPAWIGIGEFIRISAMPPEMPGVPIRLAQRIADEIQPHTGDRDARQAYGMLHLHAALRTAVAGDRAGALDHVREAREAAESLGEPEELGLARFAFGPTNVGFWTVAIQLELGDPLLALEAARDLAPGRIPLANRQGPFYADIGTALANVGGRDNEAIAAFLRAEAVGPQWIRLRPTIRDTISSILRRTRRNAVSKQMRQAAASVNLHDMIRD